MRKNWLMTVAGIIGLFSGLPTVWGTAVREGAIHTPMPGWLYVICMFSLPLSLGIVGISGKGQDEHSTLDQVEKSTIIKQAEPLPPKPGDILPKPQG